MSNKLSISVNIAEKVYPLIIADKDEEKIRKAAKKINETVLQYKNKYSGNDKDSQDFLAMATLHFVAKLQELEDRQDTSHIIDDLENLDSELAEYLKSK